MVETGQYPVRSFRRLCESEAELNTCGRQRRQVNCRRLYESEAELNTCGHILVVVEAFVHKCRERALTVPRLELPIRNRAGANTHRCSGSSFLLPKTRKRPLQHGAPQHYYHNTPKIESQHSASRKRCFLRFIPFYMKLFV